MGRRPGMAGVDSQLVKDVLEEYGELIRGRVQRYLQPLQPTPALYGPVSDYPLRPGRMLRSSLCVATARTFGASLDDVLDAAASIELAHNAFLVHDDIEDGG